MCDGGGKVADGMPPSSTRWRPQKPHFCQMAGARLARTLERPRRLPTACQRTGVTCGPARSHRHAFRRISPVHGPSALLTRQDSRGWVRDAPRPLGDLQFCADSRRGPTDRTPTEPARVRWVIHPASCPLAVAPAGRVVPVALPRTRTDCPRWRLPTGAPSRAAVAFTPATLGVRHGPDI